MNSVEFLECFEVSHDHFLQMHKFLPNMDQIWRWRHRSWPEVEKWTAQHKFLIDYDAKRIRSISLTSFEKKIQNCPSFKKISTLDFSNLAIQQNYQCKRNNKNWSHFTTSSRNQIRGVYRERLEGLVEDRAFVTSLLSRVLRLWRLEPKNTTKTLNIFNLCFY